MNKEKKIYRGLTITVFVPSILVDIIVRELTRTFFVPST